MAASRGLKKIRFLHISDIHMGFRWFLKYGVDNRVEDVLKKAFKKLEDFVKREEIDFLLIGGDLYENNRVDIEDIRFLMEVFKALKIPVYISPGNHDYYGESYYLSSRLELSGLNNWPENVRIFSSNKITKFDSSDFDIYGRANYGMDERPFDLSISPDQSKINIYLFHGSRQDFIPPQKEMWLPFYDRELIDSPFDYIALGHYHSYYEVTDLDRVRGIYPGSFIPCAIDELDDRFGVIIEIEKGDDLMNISVHKERFSDFIIRSIEVDFNNEKGDLLRGKILEKLKTIGDIKDTFLRIKVNGSGRLLKEDIEDVIRDYLSDRCMGFEVNLKDYIYEDLSMLTSEDTVEGRFLRKMKEMIENESDLEKRLIYENALRYGLDAFKGREIKPRYEDI